jgi:predicted regulator of Ras-like GTPase activity (Roadblock/LC7/MglB family)
MNLFRRLGAVLPGAKDQGPGEVEDDPGGFGPPGGLVWTTPTDVLSDRPKSLPSVPEASAAAASHAEASFGQGDQDETRAYSYGARGGPVRAAVPPAGAAASVQPVTVPIPEAAPSVPVALEPVLAQIPRPASFDAPSPEPADSSTDIAATADISGFVAACLVDSESGFMLASEGGESMDLEAAAALNTQVVRAEHEVIEALRLEDHIEDILITMKRQLHFLRPLEASPSVFLYVCLDKKGANLGMARMQVNKIESGLRL